MLDMDNCRQTWNQVRLPNIKHTLIPAPLAVNPQRSTIRCRSHCELGVFFDSRAPVGKLATGVGAIPISPLAKTTSEVPVLLFLLHRN